MSNNPWRVHVQATENAVNNERPSYTSESAVSVAPYSRFETVAAEDFYLYQSRLSETTSKDDQHGQPASGSTIETSAAGLSKLENSFADLRLPQAGQESVAAKPSSHETASLSSNAPTLHGNETATKDDPDTAKPGYESLFEQELHEFRLKAIEEAKKNKHWDEVVLYLEELIASLPVTAYQATTIAKLDLVDARLHQGGQEQHALSLGELDEISLRKLIPAQSQRHMYLLAQTQLRYFDDVKVAKATCETLLKMASEANGGKWSNVPVEYLVLMVGICEKTGEGLAARFWRSRLPADQRNIVTTPTSVIPRTKDTVTSPSTAQVPLYTQPNVLMNDPFSISEDEEDALVQVVVQAVTTEWPEDCLEFFEANKSYITTRFRFHNVSDQTALHIACAYGQSAAVQYLLDHGASVDARNCDGQSALHVAAYSGNAAIVELLVRNGPIVDYTPRDIWQATPLHLAIANGHTSAAKVLFIAVDDLLLPDSSGLTPLDLAIIGQQSEFLDHFLRYGSSILYYENEVVRSALHLAAAISTEDIVKRLVKLVPVNLRDPTGRTPLHYAAANNNAEVIMTLFMNGAEIDAVDENWWTPLLLAAHLGHHAVVQTLLAMHASTSSANYRGRTALHLAAFNGHSDIVTRLVTVGAPLNRFDNNGWTAMGLAELAGQRDIGEFLYNAGETQSRYYPTFRAVSEKEFSGATDTGIKAVPEKLPVKKKEPSRLAAFFRR